MRPPLLGRTRLIAVDGPSGSGKTTYAAELARELGAIVVSTDDFATWDDPVAWWPRLVEGVLAPIEQGRPGRYRRTEWTDGHPHPGEYRHVEVPEVLVIEGVSSGRQSIMSRLSLLVWCEVYDSRVRFGRVLERDGEGVRIPLLNWQNFERGWYAVDQTKSRSDVVRAGSDTESLPTGSSPPSARRG